MALTTFTAAQVLTAAQLNAVQANDYNQTVSTKTASYTLVAADKGTRVVMNVASANTVTVNTSLFSAGDTLVIQNIGAGVTTVTAGTATVSSAGPLAIPTNGSGTLYFTSAGVSIFYPSAGPAASSGLTLIASTSLSGASTTVSNAFSATYDNYRIYIYDVINTNGAAHKFVLGSTTTNYEFTEMYCNNASAWTFASSSPNTSFQVSPANTVDQVSVIIDLSMPFLSRPTGFISMSSGYSTERDMTIGVQDSTTSFTAFTYSTTVGTFTGNVKVYGLANS
jgi:hypothetical protein